MEIDEIMNITLRVNLPLFKRQKQWLVDKVWEEDTEHIIWGLVHLLDEIQEALEENGNNLVFKTK